MVTLRAMKYGTTTDATATRFRYPAPLFHAYRLVHALRGAFHALGCLESRLMRPRLRRTAIDRPLYICGVPRCGTTILLEMLSAHPSVATHQYADMLMPYVPYAWAALMKGARPLMRDEPRERLHRDRIVVTNLSAESVEETLWLRYFDGLHSEASSCVLGAGDAHPRFDRFYRDTIKKLLLARGRPRYLSKANYNVTRLGYLTRLFPHARVLLVIRHPAHHVASLVKQDRLLSSLAQADPRVATILRITGRFEFGADKRWPRVGDDTSEIRRLYAGGRVARAWAMHWAAVYDFVHRQLEASAGLAAQTLVVRYEDLCQDPGDTIDRILAHCELGASAFAATRARYLSTLAAPTYYRPSFSPQELADIDEATAAVRARYGYHLDAREALAEAGAHA